MISKHLSHSLWPGSAGWVFISYMTPFFTKKESGSTCAVPFSWIIQIVTSASIDLQDYTYYFVAAPWLSVKLLRLLQCYPPPGMVQYNHLFPWVKKDTCQLTIICSGCLLQPSQHPSTQIKNWALIFMMHNHFCVVYLWLFPAVVFPEKNFFVYLSLHISFSLETAVNQLVCMCMDHSTWNNLRAHVD